MHAFIVPRPANGVHCQTANAPTIIYSYAHKHTSRHCTGSESTAKRYVCVCVRVINEKLFQFSLHSVFFFLFYFDSKTVVGLACRLSKIGKIRRKRLVYMRSPRKVRANTHIYADILTFCIVKVRNSWWSWRPTPLHSPVGMKHTAGHNKNATTENELSYRNEVLW